MEERQRIRSTSMIMTSWSVLMVVAATVAVAAPSTCDAFVAPSPRRIPSAAVASAAASRNAGFASQWRLNVASLDKETSTASSNAGSNAGSKDGQPSSDAAADNAVGTKWERRRKDQPYSPRLQKARKLLDQLAADQEASLMSPSPSLPTVRMTPLPPNGLTKSNLNANADASIIGNGSVNGSANGSSDHGIAVGPSSSLDAGVNGDGSQIVVDDNVWVNGLLDGGDVVTRYAFRRGVKVAEPLVKYDPVAAEKLLFRQPTKWLVRNVQIAGPFGLWAAGVVFDFLMGKSKSSDQRRKRAAQLQQAISGLGPAIIKAGQALASRPDLLPSEYLDELQKLQDDVPRFSNDLAFRIVDQELGVNFDDIFELVEDEPIAAASIGQVYKARLKANGDTVALKIQRPNCEQIIALDLYVLRWWSGVYNKLFEFLNRDINVQSIIDDFGDLIYREIDYVAEAANAQRFNELYAGVTDVFVPKVYSDLTTRKVLVMEWVDGVRISDTDALARYGLEPKKLIDCLVQCSLQQILENGFFHADPHAGNLLACPDGKLCYLDFGMVSYADRSQRNGFVLAVVHIVNRDWDQLVRVYQRLGFIPEDTDVEPIKAALEKALPDVLNADVSELNFKNVINSLGDIMYTYPFSLPPFYIAIIRCLGVLEGVAIQVEPSSRIISDAYPYVASRVLTDPQDDMHEALKRLALTSDGRIRWNRLESLLDEAKSSSGYDVLAALDVLTDYIISDEGSLLLTDLSDQLVEATDSLGAETVGYLSRASAALAINDEVTAVRAFRTFQRLISQQGNVAEDVRTSLPNMPPTMARFSRIIELLDTGATDTDVSKFIPIVRKLAQEPKVQVAANEFVVRLGERLLSRGLRAVLGLPAPDFNARR